MDIYKFSDIVYKMIIKYLQLTVNSFLRFNLLFFFALLFDNSQPVKHFTGRIYIKYMISHVNLYNLFHNLKSFLFMQVFNMRIDTIFSTFQLPAQKNILSAMHLQASQRFLVLLNLRYEKKSPLPERQRAITDFSSHVFSRFQMTQNLLDAETAQQIKYFSKRPFVFPENMI